MTLYFLIFGNLIGARIGSMQGVSYIEYIVPGIIMMPIIQNSYGNAVFSFFGAKFQKNIEEVLVAPVPNHIILLGFIGAAVVRGVMVGAIVTFISLFFSELNIHNIYLTGLVILLTAVLFALAGLINGIFAKSFDDTSIVPTFILTPLTYLAGVFYSISLLPAFWRHITQINPIFYIVDAFRYAVLGYSEVNIQLSVSILILAIVVFYYFAIRLLNKGVGIRT
jgi:ABC-2 type transport system permease protein